MKSLGKQRVIVRNFFNGELKREAVENRVVYEKDGEFYINDLNQKRKIERLADGTFLSNQYAKDIDSSGAFPFEMFQSNVLKAIDEKRKKAVDEAIACLKRCCPTGCERAPKDRDDVCKYREIGELLEHELSLKDRAIEARDCMIEDLLALRKA